MTARATATVIVVSRDRWSLAPTTLDLLLARTDPRHPVIVVDGRAPHAVAAAFDRQAATGRVRVVRRNRFLAGNEARNIGADGVTTEWVALVENDAVLSDGWLETLLAVGELRDAASVYPTYLERRARGLFVHGLGADLEVGGPPGARHLRERQFHLGRAWEEVAGELTSTARVQGEPHAMVVRRSVLEQMGGFDEGILGWFDHTDLALHHLRLGVESWFVPDATCLYLSPPPVALKDLSSFMLRWGGDWYERSLDRLCDAWGLDRHDVEWNHHARYRTDVRRTVPTPWRRVNAVFDHASVPAERVVAARWKARAG